ncbi:unnamed protein product [Arctia plantaginis]|uniref:Uncharacterized protein n=1 Tax=Arctia plantaginis TaxID=874455 RepID=A0A8S1ADR1_ARCPL|nr:unnamed protein product [Arctia plantaginis]
MLAAKLLKYFEALKSNLQKRNSRKNVDQSEPNTGMPTNRNRDRLEQSLGLIPLPNTFLEPTPDLDRYGGIKLGWVQGVLIPCLLNIWGVMLFLRIAWIVAQAGIGFTLVIIFISGVVCVITTLSLSAICTNGQLKGGGIYFLVSRSLGAELGASVGLIFAFANSVAASMNTIGFCESFNDLLKSHGVKIIDNAENDTRIIGSIALLVMCIICAIGMDWETKAQNFLIVTIVAAIFNYIIGALMGPATVHEKVQGFVGISKETAKQNWGPDFRTSEGEDHHFITIFAIYFPSMTGVQSGANICGDLRDPAAAIPKGTLFALAISITSYLIMAVLSGTGALRDASGEIAHVGNSTLLASCKPSCKYGLHNNYEIMQLMALWGPLIYAGCWAATLSTALTNLLSVPRLVQALGTDRIYPGLIFFSKQYGRHGEAYRGYVLVFIISLLFLLIADLNTIAPLITNFYLASYALINFCTFHAAFVKPINWRPGFRYYNLWLSFAGFVMCVIIMMIISWLMALVTTFIFLTLYLIVLYRHPETDWAGSTDAQNYQVTVTKILEMSKRRANTKSFNPQLLILTGPPHEREWLLDMGKIITAVGSFCIMAEIQQEKVNAADRNAKINFGQEWMQLRDARGFYVFLDGYSLEEGLRTLILCSGLGSLAPNIFLIGFMYRWRVCPHAMLTTYYRCISLAFELGLAVTVLRVSGTYRPPKRQKVNFENPKIDSNTSDNDEQSQILQITANDSDIDTSIKKKDGQESDKETLQLAPDSFVQATVSEQISGAYNVYGAYRPLVFQQGSTLDVWWLYNDGGINVLLPYIIANRGCKHKMMLRIFVLPYPGVKTIDSYNSVKNLFQKFRIEYSHLTVIEDIHVPPQTLTWDMFNSLIENHKSEKVDGVQDPILISGDVLNKLLRKTTKHLRIRELVLQHSFAADLIVMTLPYPRQDTVPAALYLAWLDIISHDLPPTLFVRGSPQTTVLHA